MQGPTHRSSTPRWSDRSELSTPAAISPVAVSAPPSPTMLRVEPSRIGTFHKGPRVVADATVPIPDAGVGFGSGEGTIVRLAAACRALTSALAVISSFRRCETVSCRAEASPAVAFSTTAHSSGWHDSRARSLTGAVGERTGTSPTHLYLGDD